MEIATILTLVGTLGGMILPPVVDFIKAKFLPESAKTPESTMSTLATTNPMALSGYVESMGKYLLAQKDYFNRDVVGSPSLWVVNLRAAIRPIAVVGSFIIIGCDLIKQLNLDPATRAGLFAVIGNWIGSRITQ